jgi:hypothetical protein
MLDVKRDVRIFGQERASYLGVPVRQLPSSLAGTNGEVCRPALAEKRPTGRVPVYPNDEAHWNQECRFLTDCTHGVLLCARNFFSKIQHIRIRRTIEWGLFAVRLHISCLGSLPKTSSTAARGTRTHGGSP